ncbi:HNH domain-containing protein [Vibrio mytili]|uniref:HNH domain-containing protein n=2 Tax=Vibrio mytili TaxID=50718 RepID=A0A0C3DLB0_9VIBR|nr:hypothetical protein SU60_02870 [Vibrio mytili]
MIFRCNDCGRRIAESDKGRCSQHRREYNRVSDRNRNRKNHSAQYGYEWQKTRAYMRAIYPLCLNCFLNDRLTLADEVDHIRNLNDGSQFTDIHGHENLAPLCKKCHTWKTYNIDPLPRNSPTLRRWIKHMNTAKRKFNNG